MGGYFSKTITPTNTMAATFKFKDDAMYACTFELVARIRATREYATKATLNVYAPTPSVADDVEKYTGYKCIIQAYDFKIDPLIQVVPYIINFTASRRTAFTDRESVLVAASTELHFNLGNSQIVDGGRMHVCAPTDALMLEVLTRAHEKFPKMLLTAEVIDWKPIMIPH